jgi:subfamily B ATP-binding cassette protein HlyB/CyaB
MLRSVDTNDVAPNVAPGSALHALAMVAKHLGIDASAERIQRSFSFSETEPSSDLLVGIAAELGLEARKVIVSWQELPSLANTLPAILRLKDGSTLILEGVRQDKVSGTLAILRDSLSGGDAVVAVDHTRLKDMWDGEIILIKRRFGLTDEQRPFGIAWLFGQVLKERRIFFDVSVAALFSTAFAIAPPFIFMVVIDRVLQNHSYSTLEVIVAAIFVMIIFELTLGHLRRLFTLVVTTRIDGRMNTYLLDKILKLPMDYFERNPTGKILSKINRLREVRHFLTGPLFGAFLDSVPLLGILPVMLILDWRLTIVVLTLAAIIFTIVVIFLKPMSKRYRRLVLAEQIRGAHLVESIYGMRTIKSLALEGRRRFEWDKRVAETISAHHALGMMANYPQTLSLPFERLIYSGSFALGAYFVLTAQDSTISSALNPGFVALNPAEVGGTLTPGALIAFALLSMRLASPLVQIARLMQDLAEVRGSINEVASVVNVAPEEGRDGTGLSLPIRGQVQFKSVSFRYSPDAAYALDDVSFEIPKGTMLGIMGRSGSGKTTVTRLLQGLHRGYEGIIKIDGMDLREIDLDHLRMNIGVVPQENFLFSGSIRENIAMAKPNAAFADVIRAAQLAGAEEFIERMPRGYDTLLEEGAVNLSGGQRQRLAIARALIIDPPVLVFDEATSALDAESETIINANLQRIAEGRTIILVSHRLSMLVPADAILVLERGKVYDIGRHEELLVRCDIYKHLWHQQNRHVDRAGPRIQVASTNVSEV